LTGKLIELASSSVYDCRYDEHSIQEFGVEEGGFDDVSLCGKIRGGREEGWFQLAELSKESTERGCVSRMKDEGGGLTMLFHPR